MNYIVEFANDPNSLTPQQINELKSELVNVVKHKIDKLEKKYNIKIKFPKNLCNVKDNQKLPLPIIPTPIEITPTNITLYAPVDVIVGDFSEQSSIDRLSSCMKIVNSIKQNLEDYTDGKITKSQVDATFFDWVSTKEDYLEKTYGSEIEEKYEQKFGDDALLNNLIERLELTHNL